MTNEIWKPVIGYAGYYEVSNLGQVRSVDRTLTQIRHGKECKVRLRGKIIKPSAMKNGYLGVSLSREDSIDGFKVHILVAGAFIRPLQKGEEVGHRDHNRQNNVDDNLEITTHLENMGYSARAGRMAKKLNIAQVCQIKYALLWGDRKQSLADQFGVSRVNINSIALGKTWKHVNLSEILTAHD